MHIDLVGSVSAAGTTGGEINKTRTLYSYLCEEHDVRLLDYEKYRGWRTLLFFLILIIRTADRKSEMIVVSKSFVGAYHVNRVICACNIHKKRLKYFIVGTPIGRIRKDPKYIRRLASMEAVYSETESQTSELQAMGVNSKHAPNWKLNTYPEHDFSKCYASSGDKGTKVLFFSRICEAKGYRTLIDSVLLLVAQGLDVSLDLYGEVDDSEKEYFADVIVGHDFLLHKGTIRLEQAADYERLAQYDCMVLPTRHAGEGVPGAVLDCFIAGVPVITIDTPASREIIRDSENGFLYDGHEPGALDASIKSICMMDSDIMSHMRRACRDSVSRYRIQSILKGEFDE